MERPEYLSWFLHARRGIEAGDARRSPETFPTLFPGTGNGATKPLCHDRATNYGPRQVPLWPDKSYLDYESAETIPVVVCWDDETGKEGVDGHIR